MAKPTSIVYFMVFISQFIGILFGLDILVDSSRSILYNTGVLIDRQVWGGLLFIAATLVQLGMVTCRKYLVTCFSMAAFMLWVSAGIDLVMHGDIYVLVSVACMHMAIFAYTYLGIGRGITSENRPQ